MRIKELAGSLLWMSAFFVSGTVHALTNPIIQITNVERTESAIVVEGNATILPPGTEFWVEVKSINGRPLGNRHVIKTTGKASTDTNGHFVATLQRFGSLDRFDFPRGAYTLEFFAGFGASWQSPTVARAAGVVFGRQGFSDSEPHALPQSSDLVLNSGGVEKVRFLRASRTVNIQAGLSTSGYQTKQIRLEIIDPSSTKNPVRSINATGALVREVPSKVGRVPRGQAVALVCVGDIQHSAGYVVNDLYSSDGNLNRDFKANFATTLLELCHQQEDDLRRRHLR